MEHLQPWSCHMHTHPCACAPNTQATTRANRYIHTHAHHVLFNTRTQKNENKIKDHGERNDMGHGALVSVTALGVIGLSVCCSAFFFYGFESAVLLSV